MNDDEVEAVASAFFRAEYDDSYWEQASEQLKDVFRMEARLAIACLDANYIGAEAGPMTWPAPSRQETAFLH
jgi:hypothetical protein